VGPGLGSGVWRLRCGRGLAVGRWCEEEIWSGGEWQCCACCCGPLRLSGWGVSVWLGHGRGPEGAEGAARKKS
jgi:hypothetical protein